VVSDVDKSGIYDPACRLCPRLACFLDDVKARYPDYDCKPVRPFGAQDARLLIVGLAPGMHGANASGRPFTGDHAGILLYQALYDFGFANQPEASHAGDGLELSGCRITNAVKCLPPENKPVAAEVNQCNGYLKHELAMLAPGSVILSLGLLSHKAVIKALGYRQADFRFGHGAAFVLDNGVTLIDSYHCSRYNTNTSRLTREMFYQVFTLVRQTLAHD